MKMRIRSGFVSNSSSSSFIAVVVDAKAVSNKHKSKFEIERFIDVEGLESFLDGNYYGYDVMRTDETETMDFEEVENIKIDLQKLFPDSTIKIICGQEYC
jgi:hypothetical protein